LIGLVKAGCQQQWQQPHNALGRQLHPAIPFSLSIPAGGRCRRPHSVAASGIRIWNSVPRPAFDCTSTLPWCNWRIRYVIASPIPLPPVLVVK
jgi:hypothetical protein